MMLFSTVTTIKRNEYLGDLFFNFNNTIYVLESIEQYRGPRIRRYKSIPKYFFIGKYEIKDNIYKISKGLILSENNDILYANLDDTVIISPDVYLVKNPMMSYIKNKLQNHWLVNKKPILIKEAQFKALENDGSKEINNEDINNFIIENFSTLNDIIFDS